MTAQELHDVLIQNGWQIADYSTKREISYVKNSSRITLVNKKKIDAFVHGHPVFGTLEKTYVWNERIRIEDSSGLQGLASLSPL